MLRWKYAVPAPHLAGSASNTIQNPVPSEPGSLGACPRLLLGFCRGPAPWTPVALRGFIEQFPKPRPNRAQKHIQNRPLHAPYHCETFIPIASSEEASPGGLGAGPQKSDSWVMFTGSQPPAPPWFCQASSNRTCKHHCP